MICFAKIGLAQLLAALGSLAAEHSVDDNAGLLVGPHHKTGAITVEMAISMGVNPNGKPLPGFENIFLWVSPLLISPSRDIEVSFIEKTVSGHVLMEPRISAHIVGERLCVEVDDFKASR